MNTRIKEIRKALKLNQSEFGEKLGVTGNYIYILESGNKPITDKFKYILCNTFSVNEDWLNSGIGEMFTPITREDRIAEITALLYKETNEVKEEFVINLIKVIADMSPEQIEILKEAAIKLADLSKENN